MSVAVSKLGDGVLELDERPSKLGGGLGRSGWFFRVGGGWEGEAGMAGCAGGSSICAFCDVSAEVAGGDGRSPPHARFVCTELMSQAPHPRHFRCRSSLAECRTQFSGVSP